MKNARYRFPEQAAPMWKAVLRVARSFELVPMEAARPQSLWPVLGLAKRVSSLARAIGVLASEQLWSEAVVQMRVLIEAQLLIEWMLKEPESRCAVYAAGINEEEVRLLKKLNSSGAVTFQILSDPSLYDAVSDKVQNSRADRRPDLRRIALEADDEESYDTGYWIASAFVHNHPLALMKYCRAFVDVSQALEGFFSEEFLSYIVMYGSVTCVLHPLQAVDEKLGLDLKPGLDRAWELFHAATVTESEGVLKYSTEIGPDDMLVGDKVYTTRRRGAPIGKRRET